MLKQILLLVAGRYIVIVRICSHCTASRTFSCISNGFFAVNIASKDISLKFGVVIFV